MAEEERIVLRSIVRKYRIYPNNEQEVYFAKCFGSVRFVYNKMLADKQEYYKETGNLLTKIKSLLAGFSLVHFRHGKQTGIKSGLCFSINGSMLLGKPPSLVRSKCAGTCSGQLFWPVSCFCLQLLFSGCSCIRCNLWVPDGS